MSELQARRHSVVDAHIKAEAVHHSVSSTVATSAIRGMKFPRWMSLQMARKP
jgi:hypothetical protein